MEWKRMKNPFPILKKSLIRQREKGRCKNMGWIDELYKEIITWPIVENEDELKT